MFKSKFTKGFIVLLAGILLLTGCSGGKEKDSDNPGTSAPSASNEKVLTIANATDIESFDAHNNNNTYSEAVLVNVYDYLLKNDSAQNKQASLAVSWEAVDDTTWRFKLRDDVKFHNGDPFTAADVKFSLERVAKDSGLKQHSYYKDLKEVNIIDEYTVDIVTNHPDPIMLNRLSRMGADILPAKYIEENGMEAFLKAPIGTGPYKFSKWAKDDRIELVKNEDYFASESKWDKVVFRMVPEASTRVSELITGGVDVAANVPSTDVQRINDSGKAKIEEATIQRVLHVLMRMTEGSITADPKVREAIELAIDNQAIIDSIAGGAGIPTRTSVTPGNFGADPSLYDQYVYDQEKAKELLKEAGYESGAKITFTAASNYKEVAEVTAAMLTSVGFEVNLEILEPSKFSETYNAKKFKELFLLGVGNSLFDASNNYNRFLVENAAGETDYNNAEVESLLQAASVNMNTADREQQFQQVQQHIATDRPTIYLYQMKGIYGVGERVTYTPRLDEMFFADEIIPVQ
ncbi:ABC transporter substrate-binding protein [Paenibacillaceae bacterium]|nr:ABC transporter substrate-binding protein [Paenibacillaceae bacterium]